jgi:pyridoxal phosphate enzyme (YggS family)
MTIYQTLEAVLDRAGVTLVAVSKTKPVGQIMEIYDQGQRVFGENRVQELVEKYPAMPKDIEWHMIGHLQTNKVKHIAAFVSMIHAVDSIKLLNTISNQGIQHDRRIDVLLQLKIATEESKFGFNIDDLIAQLSALKLDALKGVHIRGVMGMATFSDDKDLVRAEFRTLKRCYDKLKAEVFPEREFDTISMGMSGDYELAIEEGSTMVRIGSMIFGARN